MLSIKPTKNGLGVELWGEEEDLKRLYLFIQNFWHDIESPNELAKGEVISYFSYEIRKGFEGKRLNRGNRYFGVNIYWIHYICSLTCLKSNASLIPTSKEDVAMFQALEKLFIEAMKEYDSVGAQGLEPYLNALYGNNKYMYQFMRQATTDHVKTGGGKPAFRSLPILLQGGIYATEPYKEFVRSLKKSASEFGVPPETIEFNDDEIYENLIW
ncbi:hypothetical protein [Flammeovirga sp. OC4]|uniref:DUF6904 family protein n=1 Tax=Flammeovirga sp. OC4 TaxID=1382345 RepID=UPI0005C5B231|nr:hypothetical protein [Flammeovirga sp. OC4]